MTSKILELDLDLPEDVQNTISSLPWLVKETADFSVGSGLMDKKWKKSNLSFALVIAQLMQHNIGPKEGSSFLQGCLAEHRSPRNKKAMTEMHILALDIDNGFPLEDMITKIKKQNWLAVLYTSHSHGKSVSEISTKQIINKLDLKKLEKDVSSDDAKRFLLDIKRYHPPLLEKMSSEIIHSTAGLVAKVTHASMDKYRVVFFLDETFYPGTVADTHEKGMAMWARKYAGVAQVLEVEFDAACTDVSRLMFYGRHNRDAIHISKLISGDTLILDDIEDGNPTGFIPSTGNDMLDKIAMEEALQNSGGKKEDYTPRIPGIKEFMNEHREAFLAHDFWTAYGGEPTTPNGGVDEKDHFECPNHSAHTDPNAMAGFAVANPGSHHDDAPLIKCLHESCSGYTDWMQLDMFMHANEMKLEDLLEYVTEVSGNSNSTVSSLEEFAAQSEKEQRVKAADKKVKQVLSKDEVPEPGVYTDAISINLGINEDTYADMSEDEQDLVSILANLNADHPDGGIITTALIALLVKLDLGDVITDSYIKMLSRCSGFGKIVLTKQFSSQKAKVKKALKAKDVKKSSEKSMYPKETLSILEDMNELHTLIGLGKNDVIMYDKNYRDNPGEGELSFKNMLAFTNRLKNRQLKVFDHNKGEYVMKNAADVWMEWTERREFSELTFDPSISLEKRVDVDYGQGLPYNLWNGFKYDSDPEGKCDILLQHIRKHICHDNEEWYDFFMAWMAHIIQVPEQIPGCAVIVQGDKGCGKSIVFEEILANEILNPYGMKTSDVAKIFGGFNARVENKLLVVMSEAFWAGSKEVESNMKDAITSSSYTLSLKGIDDVERDNFRRFACTANAQFVVPATKDERRFFLLKCLPTKCGKPEYFEKMMKQLEEQNGYGKLMHILETWPEPKEGWKNYFFKPPHTPWLDEQISENTQPHERWFFDGLSEGKIDAPDDSTLEDIAFNEDEETYISTVVFHAWWKHETKFNKFAQGIKRAKSFITSNFPEVYVQTKNVPSYPYPVTCYIVPPLSQIKIKRPDIFEDAFSEAEKVAKIDTQKGET